MTNWPEFLESRIWYGSPGETLAIITEEQYNQARDAIAAIPVLQAKIDALMLEYCPEEMTIEQVAKWMYHQQPTGEL